MLNLIISRTGYGKTTFIKEKIKKLCDENKETVLIIPEQISFESERDILREVGAKKLKNVQVMSFTRLCSLFFDKYGGREKPYIDNIGKVAIMSETLKKLSPTLDLFKKSANSPQFCEMLIDLYSNIKKSAVTPDMLNTLALTNNGILSKKLFETSTILAEYTESLNKDYFDPLDDISVVASRLNDCPFFKGKTVFIDSFTGFTEQQMLIIEKAIVHSENCYISLGFDGVNSKDVLSTFSNMAKTAYRLKKIAKDNGTFVNDDIILTQNHRYNNDELDFLEKNIFSDENNCYDDTVENIKITKVTSIYEEVEFVAKEIIKLTRESGIRYRDISVISRDAGTYNEILQETFEKYEIPLFVDNREGVENLNLFKAVSFALSAVDKKFEKDAIISLVKTGIVGLSSDEASLFENYCYVHRINKKGFLEEFTLPVNEFLNGDEKLLKKASIKIEEARKKVILPLVSFNKTKGKTVASYLKAIYELLKAYNCGKSLKAQADALEKNGHLRLAESTVRSYDIMMHILDQFYLSLGDNEMSLKRFYEVFNSAVSLLDIGSLPQGLDAVAAGSAERMRPKSPKVTFIIGANDGVFPSASHGKGLFSDSELMLLKEKGINLPFYDIETAIDEQYLAYCAVCSPSQKLFVSYPISSISGETKEPSVIVDSLKKIFPSLEITNYDSSEIQSLNDALKIYAKTQNAEIAQYFDNKHNKRFEAVNEAKKDRIASISSSSAKKLYSNNIYTSASKIETFNKCRFYYFCKYGLRAKTIKEAKVDNIKRGSLAHFVLEKMLNSYTVDEFFKLDNAERKAKINEFADEYYKENISTLSPTNIEKYNYNKLCEMIFSLCNIVFEELKQSEFEVLKTELNIGGKTADIPQYELEFKDGKIILTGAIDRVDIARKNGKQFVRIIDYKTYDKSLNFAEVLYGQNIQMPLYMKAFIENGQEKYGECAPGGMFYLKAKDSVVTASKGTSDEEIKTLIAKKAKMNGSFLGEEDAYLALEPECKGLYSPVRLTKKGELVKNTPYYTKEQFNILSDYISLIIKQTANKIFDGEIAPNPTDLGNNSACKYCEYTSICHFNEEHEKIEDLKDVEVFERMNNRLKEEGEK